jgi:hypothetical protein
VDNIKTNVEDINMGIWTGFICLKIPKVISLCEHNDEEEFHKMRRFLDQLSDKQTLNGSVSSSYTIKNDFR